jgi:hypothetical protein
MWSSRRVATPPRTPRAIPWLRMIRSSIGGTPRRRRPDKIAGRAGRILLHRERDTSGKSTSA